MSIQRLRLESAEMRRQVESYFSKAKDGSVSEIEGLIVQEHKQKNPSTQPDPDETLCDEDRLEVCEALWDLIREGHLNPGRRKTPKEGWPSVYVTTKGGQYFGNK
jgi:hypothetical protein